MLFFPNVILEFHHSVFDLCRSYHTQLFDKIEPKAGHTHSKKAKEQKVSFDDEPVQNLKSKQQNPSPSHKKAVKGSKKNK